MDIFPLLFEPLDHSFSLITSTVFFFLFGILWHSESFFTGKIWRKYHLETIKRFSTLSHMIPGLLFHLFFCFVFIHTVMFLYFLARNYGFSPGISLLVTLKGFLGFVGVKEVGSYIWEKKSVDLILVQVGYYIIGLIVTLLLLVTTL